MRGRRGWALKNAVPGGRRAAGMQEGAGQGACDRVTRGLEGPKDCFPASPHRDGSSVTEGRCDCGGLFWRRKPPCSRWERGGVGVGAGRGAEQSPGRRGGRG